MNDSESKLMSKDLVNVPVDNSFSDGVRVRFAPSPTGYLHIGGLRTALFNWLFAKHNNGAFLVRIEDTDFERSKEEYTNGIISALKWASLDSDEPLIFQSHRIDAYKKIADQLIKEDKAYKCYCSQEELKMRAGSDEEYRKYDNKCKALAEDKEQSYVIRFKIPNSTMIVQYLDLIKGTLSFELNQFDDFIIVRSDGIPTYNFAVVVDDNLMAITHVLRGEDHISNTPKQLFIYEALGYKIPAFGHFPMILAPDGARLSKRYAATGVDEYKKVGFLPDALCNYLVRLGWSHGDQEIFSREELINYFSLDHVGTKASIFDIKKLEWLNAVYIKNCSAEDLFNLIKSDVEPDFEEHFQINEVKWNKEKILQLIDLYKVRSKTLAELALECKLLYKGPKDFSSKEFLGNREVNDVLEKLDKSVVDHLQECINRLTDLKEFNYDSVSNTIKNLCKDLAIKMPEIAMPIRISLTGSVSTPGVAELMALIEKKETLKMLNNFKNYLLLKR